MLFFVYQILQRTEYEAEGFVLAQYSGLQREEDYVTLPKDGVWLLGEPPM